jgi:hypothetical protein
MEQNMSRQRREQRLQKSGEKMLMEGLVEKQKFSLTLGD